MLMINNLVGFGADNSVATYRYLRLEIVKIASPVSVTALWGLGFSNDAGATWFPTSNMTTNSAPSPLVASARTEFSGSFQAWQAFDGNLGTRYTSSATGDGSGIYSPAEYVQLDLGSGNGIVCNAMRIAHYNPGGDLSLIDFNAKGSNDGTNFTLLKAYVGEPSGQTNATYKTYLF